MYVHTRNYRRKYFLIESPLRPWLQRAAQRQETAWAPGTQANYRSATKKYILFCYETGIIPTNPSYQQVCAYLEYLAHTTPSPRTVANHVSHLRTFFRKADISTQQLDAWRVKWALNALNRDKSYIPRIKNPIPAPTLQRMVTLLPDTGNGLILKAAVLLMYNAALRQSEVLAQSSRSYDSRYNLSRDDVQIIGDTLSVYIKHAKNLQSIYQTKTVNLAASPNPSVCVVRAFRLMYAQVPSRSKQDACFMFHDTRRPVPVEHVRRQWNKHLQLNGVQTAALSLHSLRKAAATEAHNQGCSELDIQRYGGWRSNSHRAYISTSQKTVNRAVVNAISQPI